MFINYGQTPLEPFPFKRSVKVAAVGNLLLYGTQTIDGIACWSGDRVLAHLQTVGAERLIYIVKAAAGSVDIASSTNASPIEITTATAHGLETGDRVTIANHLINTAANGNWTVIKVSSTKFTLTGSTGNGTGGATGTSNKITWVIAPDSDSGADLNAAIVEVQQGTNNANKLFKQTGDDLVVGTDTPVWEDAGTGAANAQTGTTYQFALADASKLCTFSNANPVVVTIPANATVAFPVGTQIDCAALGAGKVSFVAAGGVTVLSKLSYLSLLMQYSAGTLVKLDTNTWLLTGDLAE